MCSGERHEKLPEKYERPEIDRPRLSEVCGCDKVPIIDLGCEEREMIVKQVEEACKSYGFFQVNNYNFYLIGI